MYGQTITSHGSAAYSRESDDDSRHEEMRKFIDDLKVVAEKLSQRKAA